MDLIKNAFYEFTHSTVGIIICIGLFINFILWIREKLIYTKPDYLKGDPKVLENVECEICGTHPVQYEDHTPICPFCKFTWFGHSFRSLIPTSDYYREYYNLSVYDKYLKKYDRELAESDPEYVETINEKEQTDQDGITWKDNIINDNKNDYNKDDIVYIFDNK